VNTELITWLGILFCLSQSAVFSGLNLAMFGLSRLRLEVEVAAGNQAADKVLALRRDANHLLTTILWGNVAINVLLTLLSGSVLSGVVAFLFSTVDITFFGEILPQAYFSRHALRMGSLLAPVLGFYRVLLYPVAKPSAWFLDQWLGKERVDYIRERTFRHMLLKYIEAKGSEIERMEGIGALNFLDLDDTPARDLGESIAPQSIIELPVYHGQVAFPDFARSPGDPFLQRLNQSGRKWVILADPEGRPQLALNSHAFLRSALFDAIKPDPFHYCHRPLLVESVDRRMGEIITHLKFRQGKTAGQLP